MPNTIPGRPAAAGGPVSAASGSPRRRLVPVVMAGGALMVALSATPALGAVTGGCQGAGTIAGTRHDAATLDPDNPISIPEEADVAYEGSVPLPAGDTDRTYSGKIDLQLPLGNSVTVADWSGSSKLVSKAGTYHYSIPAIVPRGIKVTADGTHSHDGLPAPCMGTFSIQLEGGPLDSPAPTAAAAAGTLATGAALITAARPKGGRP
ncbi:MAG: hypothetical protein ACRDZ7_22930 [Acidimicrobiia bacterium]